MWTFGENTQIWNASIAGCHCEVWYDRHYNRSNPWCVDVQTPDLTWVCTACCGSEAEAKAAAEAFARKLGA